MTFEAKDWQRSKDKFLRFAPGYRLGSIATNLSRISNIAQEGQREVIIPDLIREAVYFIEWTAADVNLDIAVELVDIGRQINRWKFHWPLDWNDQQRRQAMSHQARVWSNQLLEHSGLLSQ